MYNQYDVAEMTVWDFWGYIVKHIAVSIFWSEVAHTEGSQLQCHEDTQAALWKVLHGKELRLPSNH